jgi:hypothetical protein
MQDRRLLWAFAATSGICWASWVYFLFIFDIGSSSPADPWRIAYYVLLILAPAITFVPIAFRLRWHFFGPYAVVGWAAFGYLLAFVHPPVQVLTGDRSPLTAWYFFLVLLVVWTTVLAPLAHTIGLRLFTSRTHQRDLLRSWREAGLLSFYLVGLAIGRSLGLLTWPIALLSLLLLALVEALFLARKG